MKKLEIHPLSELFPPMSKAEFAALKGDIESYGGLRETITVWKGQVIDGRHRVKACEELGIDISEDIHVLDDDEDPLDYVLAQNAIRRHMTQLQRAFLAARTMKAGDNGHALQVKEAASKCSVSSGYVSQAKRVIEKGAPRLVKLTESGEISLPRAAEFVKVAGPVKEQRSILNASRKVDETLQAIDSFLGHVAEQPPEDDPVEDERNDEPKDKKVFDEDETDYDPQDKKLTQAQKKMEFAKRKQKARKVCQQLTDAIGDLHVWKNSKNQSKQCDKLIGSVISQINSW